VTEAFLSSPVILTRPSGRNEAVAARLAAAGMPVLILPALNIQPVPPPDTKSFHPRFYDLIVFVSSNAVEGYLGLLGKTAFQGPWPAGTLAATVGAASAGLLYKSHVVPATRVLHPDADASQDSEALWRLLEPRLSSLRRVLIVRGQSGREWLGERLETANVAVDRLAVYTREAALWTPDELQRLGAALTTSARCVVLLTSGESVDAVHANIERAGLLPPWRRSRFVVIHERVARRLQSVLGASGKVESTMVKVCSPGDDAIVESIRQMASL
jgi:uroporphyrinogen-III synthase